MDQDGEFSAFVAAEWERLLRSAVLLGCTLAEAEDLTQTALVRCYLKWHLVRRAENRRAYAARILLNALREHKRRASSTERPVAMVFDLASEADEAERFASVDAVRRALAVLGPDHREVVLLRYYLQLSERECAEAIGVRPGTVKSRLSRAIAQLADSPELFSFRPDRPGEGS